jgi:hypothetical protein
MECRVSSLRRSVYGRKRRTDDERFDERSIEGSRFQVLQHEAHKMVTVPDDIKVADPVLLKDPELEQIAMATLLIGRLLMETGARAEVVHEDCSLVAHGFGADHVDLRSGYASIDITVGRGPSTITRTMEVGPHGVDHRLSYAIRDLVRRVRQGSLTPPDVERSASATGTPAASSRVHT